MVVKIILEICTDNNITPLEVSLKFNNENCVSIPNKRKITKATALPSSSHSALARALGFLLQSINKVSLIQFHNILNSISLDSCMSNST